MFWALEAIIRFLSKRAFMSGYIKCTTARKY